MRHVFFFVAAAVFLFQTASGALALNALTDDQMTGISGAAGITIAVNDLSLRMEATGATLNLNPDRPTSTGHFLNIEDDADTDAVAITIASGTDDTSAAHEWLPATIDMRLQLDVADDGTRPIVNLALYNWDGNMYLKADRLEVNDSGHTNNLLFGLNVGEIDFAPDGTNPSMYMRLASHDSGTGISGELGMKLLVGEVGFTGINNGTAHGIGLLFCENFTDNASAIASTANWSTSYWLSSTGSNASGMWTMGNLDYRPLTLDVATYSQGGTPRHWIIMTIQGGLTKRFTYQDIGSSNMGTTTAWGYDSNGNGDVEPGEIIVNNPNSATYNTQNTWNSVLGEVRLDYIEAYVDGTTRNIGGLALEDLAMERTYMVMTPDGDPYSNHIFTTNALNPSGLETELPTIAGVAGSGASSVGGADTTLANWNNGP